MAELVKILDEKLKKSSFLRRAALKSASSLPVGKDAVSRLYRMRGYVALFVFSFGGAAPGVRNFLECRIYENEKDLLYLPLSRLTGVITEGYRYLEYPYIATEEQMAEAMDELLGALEELDPAITAFFCQGQERDRVYGEMVGEINRYCGERVLSYAGRVSLADEEIDPRALQKMLRFFYAARIADRVAGPFSEFFRNRPVNASDALSAYRRKDGETELVAALPPEKVGISDLQKRLFHLAKRQSGVSLLPALLVAMAGCTLILGPILALFCLALYYFAAGGFDPSVLYHTALQGPFYALAVLPLFCGGILWLCFDERPVFFLLYGKKGKDYAAALHSPIERRMAGMAGSLILAALIVLSLLGGRCGVAFKEDYFSDRSSFFSLESVNYTYDKLKEGAIVADPDGAQDSFLLLLEDGRALYLGQASEQDALLRLLEEKGVALTRYESKQALYDAHPHLAPEEQSSNDLAKGES